MRLHQSVMFEVLTMRKVLLLSTLFLPTALCGAQMPQPSQAISPSPIHALNSRSSPATYDSIIRAFADSVCAITGCVVEVPPDYSPQREQIQFYDQRNSPAVIPAGGRLNDRRGGGNRNLSVDLTGGPYALATPWTDECFNHINAYDCALISQIDLFSGYSIGNPAWNAKAQGWTSSAALRLNKFSPSAGITTGFNITVNKNGIGDVQGLYAYVFGRGGQRAASDEALEVLAANGGEAGPPAFAATITSVDPSNTRLHLQPLRANGTQGAGRMLIDTTPTSLVTSGCITAQTRAQEPATNPPDVTQFTLGCGASVKHLATSWGTLTTTIDPPILPSTSNASVTTTNSMVDFYAVSGTPAIGEIGCFAGTANDGFHEAAIIVAVAPGKQAHHFNVTYAARVRHPAGSFVVNGKTGCMGIELKANTFGTPDAPNHNGLRYVLDTLGCKDEHTCWAVQFQSSGSRQVNPAQMTMQVNATTAPIVNTKGIVTLTLTDTNTSNFPLFANLPVITISGSDDPAFNGQCTNTYITPNAPPDTIYCSQASSTGHTSATSKATVTIGDTGYGNTRFNLFYEAQVLDFKDYSKSPPTLPDNPILRLEPNALPLPIGGTVEEPNDYAAGYVGQHLGLQVFNPYADMTLRSEGTGPYLDQRFSAGQSTNPASYNNPSLLHQYAGLGGTRHPPNGYTLGGFPWANFGQMENLPWPTGQSIFSVMNCPASPLGCADPNYTVLLGGYPGNNFYYRDRWTPITNTRSFEGPHHTFPEAPTATGKMKFACFNDKMELVAKVTPCDQNP
ncbi:MAG: hypothetical protein ABI357_05935 [Granulicella sp.]